VSGLKRVTLNLTRGTVKALEGVLELTGESSTDEINKAIRFYGRVLALINDGGNVYIQEPGSQQVQVWLL